MSTIKKISPSVRDTTWCRRQIALLDATDDTILILNKTGTIIQINKTGAKRLKASKEELVGQNVYTLIPPSVAEYRRNLINKVFETGESEHFQDERDGRYYDNSIYPLEWEHGTVKLATIYAKDITELVEANQNLKFEKKFSEKLINAVADTIFVLDTNTSYPIRWNKAMEEVSGYSHDEIASMKAPFDWFNKADTQKAIAAIEELYQKGKSKTTVDLITKSGKTIPTEYELSLLEDQNQNISYVLSSGRNISDRVEAQHKLARKNKELKKLIKDLQVAKERAEIGEQSKIQFLASMSHELRTPLNAVIGFSDLLNEEELTAQEIRSYSELISKNGKSLLRLISDILDLSRIDSGQLNILTEDVMLYTLCKQTVRSFCDGLKQRKKEHLEIKFTYNLPKERTIHIDPSRLNQIIGNLLDNAIKYTQHGSIELIVGESENQDFLDIEVKDTGLGISEEHLDLIFNPFNRITDNTHKSIQGTGLGLAIVKRIVEALNGNIRVKSVLGKGSSFKIQIPK